MSRKIYTLIALCIFVAGGAFAENVSFDDNWASQILFKRLWIPLKGVSADGSVCVELADSMGFFYVNAFFYPRPAKCEIKRISARWLPTNSEPESVVNAPNFLADFLMLSTYPQFIAQSHFQGYTISLLKKKVPIGGIECFKISVKPVAEDNREEAPFLGYFYVSTKPPYNVVRAESEFSRREDITRRVRWDFISLGGCDFPRRVELSLTSPMCGFLADFSIQAVFPSITAISDTSGG